MATVTKVYETQFNLDDVVVFIKYDQLLIGIIKGYYVEGNKFYFQIQTNKYHVFRKYKGGDIPEKDIVFKISEPLANSCRNWIEEIETNEL